MKNGQKTWIDISPRYTDGQQAIEKKSSPSLIIRERQIETTMNTTLHQSEWPSLISPQITNAGEGGERREPSWTVGGNVSWYNHYGEQYEGALENST